MAAKLIESTFPTARATARITTRKDAISLKDVPDGTEINYSGYVLQEITNENTGEIFMSIMIASADNQIYATRSETFIRDLKEIIDIVKDEESDEPLIIRIAHCKSKNGNKFVTCSLA